MRIRKRQVPFPLSSLSPVPLSDPLLNRSPVVQLQLHNTAQPKASHPLENLSPQSDRYAHFGPQPSDQPNQRLPPIRGGSNGLDFSDDVASGPHNEAKKKDCLVSGKWNNLLSSISFFSFFLLLFVFIYICVFMTVHFGWMCPKDFMCMNFALC